MINGWKKQLPEKYHEEFKKFFEEFEQSVGGNQSQPAINIFLINQIIVLRQELKEIKEELEQDRWVMNQPSNLHQS